MRVLHVLNQLGLGGTEKAALLWSVGAKRHGHEVLVVGLSGGMGEGRFGLWGIDHTVVQPSAHALAQVIAAMRPDVIHAHVPGYAHVGDILGDALDALPHRPRVVSTNVFGMLQNPREDHWTDARLFISWTSCVQAAYRAGVPLDRQFFARQSVVSYPLPPPDAAAGVPGVDSGRLQELSRTRRRELGFDSDTIVLGRFARPDRMKWDVPMTWAIRQTVSRRSHLAAVFQEVPESTWRRSRPFGRDRAVRLPASADPLEVAVAQRACDVIVHRSRIGESFGYALAEPMSMGLPVLTASTPWGDQAQLELVVDGVTGMVASSPTSALRALAALCDDAERRQRLGSEAARRIESIAGFDASVTKLLSVYGRVCDGTGNPNVAEDVERTRVVAGELNAAEWGSTVGERVYLRAIDATSRLRIGARRIMRGGSEPK